MKRINSIIGTNFIILFISILLLSTINNPKYEFIYFIPVIGLASFNILKSLICLYNGDKSQAKTFILSSLIILIIGGSSCVTIKLKSRDRQKEKEKPVTIVQPKPA